MRIAYLGTFLKEGLLANGVNLLELNGNSDICEQIAQSEPAVDFVLIEMLGGFSPLKHISHCGIPMIAYFIDTPLNEFWIREIAPVFDYVFVDQPQSVASLGSYGIKASWLPLPAHESYFQPETGKKRDITFIGTVNSLRPKRTNLLNLVKSGFDINIMSDVPAGELPKIFAESKIVLNENLFPGLTLRIIQGMAAGSIVFTEKSPYSHSFGLSHKKDIIYYDSGDILSNLADVLNNYKSCSEMAANAQKNCRLNFSGGKAVETMLGVISGAPPAKPSKEFLWQKTWAEFLFTQRFGGNLTEIYRRFNDFCKIPEKAALANLALGDIKAWNSKYTEAQKHYLKAIETGKLPKAYLKQALIKIAQDDLKGAASWIGLYERQWPEHAKTEEHIVTPDSAASLLNLIAAEYFQQGQKWEMGFQKPYEDMAPDTAFATAMQSWKRQPNEAAIEIMLKCLEPAHMQGELLPVLLKAIELGVLSDRLIYETANLAYNYYDHATAMTILKAMKKGR